MSTPLTVLNRQLGWIVNIIVVAMIAIVIATLVSIILIMKDRNQSAQPKKSSAASTESSISAERN